MSVTDATILGSIADGVIFVVKAGGTSIKALDFCRDKLNHVNAHFIGVILNQADIHRGTDYYYHSKYYTADMQEHPPA